MIDHPQFANDSNHAENSEQQVELWYSAVKLLCGQPCADELLKTAERKAVVDASPKWRQTVVSIVQHYVQMLVARARDCDHRPDAAESTEHIFKATVRAMCLYAQCSDRAVSSSTRQQVLAIVIDCVTTWLSEECANDWWKLFDALRTAAASPKVKLWTHPRIVEMVNTALDCVYDPSVVAELIARFYWLREEADFQQNSYTHPTVRMLTEINSTYATAATCDVARSRNDDVLAANGALCRN